MDLSSIQSFSSRPEVHHDGIFRGRLHNNHNGNLLLGPYTSAPFVSEIMLKKIYPLKYWNGMLIILYIIEISFCSAGGGWWLVLICYERKVPLVDSWLVASADLVWEKNNAGWLADKPVKQRSVCESWSTGGAISLEDWAFTNKAKQILSTRIYSTVHPNKNGHLFIFLKKHLTIIMNSPFYLWLKKLQKRNCHEYIFS